MTRIIINESQFKRLFKEGNSWPDFNGGDVTEYNTGQKISPTTTIHDEDGNPKYGKPKFTDDVADDLNPQNFFMYGQGIGRKPNIGR